MLRNYPICAAKTIGIVGVAEPPAGSIVTATPATSARFSTCGSVCIAEPAWFDWSDVLANAKQSYHPGEEK